MEETYSKWPEWQKVYVYIWTQRVVCPCPGAIYTYKKHEKLCIKSDFKYIYSFLKFATNGQRDKAFLLTSGFCPQRVICSYPGAIYMWKKKAVKMCIKSEFKEICLKLATHCRSDKGFLLTAKVCPQWVFCPCPGAIYMYKSFKNVFCIKSSFEEKLATYGQRENAFLLSSKFCPQWIVCPCPRLYTNGWNMKKM